MCDAYTHFEVGAAIALAVIDPRLWHDIASNVVRRKLGIKQSAGE